MKAGDLTLLPLRFGLIIETWDQVITDLIKPHSDGLKRLFTQLDGKREVGIKVLWHADPELEQLMAEDSQLRQDRDRLEGKVLRMDEEVSIGQAIEDRLEHRKATVSRLFGPF